MKMKARSERLQIIEKEVNTSMSPPDHYWRHLEEERRSCKVRQWRSETIRVRAARRYEDWKEILDWWHECDFD